MYSGTFPSAILPGFLYLGDASDATLASTLRALGIRRVVNCAGKMCRQIVTDDEELESSLERFNVDVHDNTRSGH